MIFKKQFTDSERIKWQNTLNKMFIQTGSDKLGMAFATLIGGDQFRRFDANIDRTKTYDDIIICSPIPKMAPSEPFNLCVKEQARYILSVIEKYSLTPYLMYSGGLDSTCTFYALVNEGVEFNVVFNQGSYNEYPKLGQELLDKKFKKVNPIFVKNDEFTLPEHADQNADSLYITGEIGDQTFGHMEMCTVDYETRQLLIEDAVDKGFFPTDVYQATVNSVRKILSGEITLSEYFWAVNFIFKYQDVLLRKGAQGLRYYGPKQNTIHFFDTDKFQLYALNNYKKNCKFIKKTEYKMELKQYIFEQNGDNEYFKNKTKEGSFFSGAYSTPVDTFILN